MIFYTLVKRGYARAVSAACMLAITAGCATLEEPIRGNIDAASAPVRACAEWFRAVDAVIDDANVRDSGAYRIPGFPYLRVDRYSASFREEARERAEALTQWLHRLRALDEDARAVELGNLPPQAVAAMGAGDRSALMQKAMQCADTLQTNDFSTPQHVSMLAERAAVPDDYAGWQRTLGLYAITKIPFARGVRQWHAAVLEDFRRAREAAPSAWPVVRYADDKPPVSREKIANILARASANPLRIPEFNAEERRFLIAAFAPVFEIESSGAYDRFGSLQWREGFSPQVDTSHPVVYTRIAFTRYGKQTLTQLVYTVWFPERPHDHAFDLLAGTLDGVVFRVTLTPDGEPLVYDSIHPCGCFHLFFPTPRVEVTSAPDGSDEWAFIPTTLPAHGVESRIVVRIAARTHYLLNVSIDDGSAGQRYEFVPEENLRMLPSGIGTRSAYGRDGIVPGTERGERVFFWPMGIPSAGAMRQWGRHATAFVGRRHFDDADLIEKRFRILPH